MPLHKKTFTNIFTVLILLYSSLSLADQLIIEPDMGRAPLISAIQEAKQSVNLVMYGFTDEQLLKPLIQQKLKGRTVKIILEKTPYKATDENSKTIAALKKNHIDWQGKILNFRFIHQKTLLLDDKKAIVMTFNFTHSSFQKVRNFALVIDDAKRVNEIKNVFAADWNQHPSSLANECIFSPDNSREKLLYLLSRAKQDIKIYAQTISDYKIIGQLAKLAKKGIKITILTSNKMQPKQENYLTKNGVQVFYIKQLYIHAKVFIIDNRLAIVGSINLTKNSLDENRELAVLTKDPSVIRELNQTFNKDVGSAKRFNLQYFLAPKQINKALSILKKLIREWNHF